MNLEQIYTGCLAQGAYFIESEGEAVVIDPLREAGPYIERAKKFGAKIKYIFETHFHADFVSGQVELSNKTGATIVYGPTAQPAFPAHIAQDGECFRLGKLQFVLLHTPGHTMESSCYLLRNEEGRDIALFTGDTLFIGDVGRPDLAQQSDETVTRELLAGMLYESLHHKIRPLHDDIIIYPAHGAGSACGKNISRETTDTLGNQKKTNYALRAGITKEELIVEVTAGLLPPPAYFPINVMLNREGADHLQSVMEKGARGLTLSAFEQIWKEHDCILLDTRSATIFAEAYIPGSINIGLEGSFAPWVGSLIPYKKQPLLFISDAGKEEEVITRLARIGYDDVVGYLEGGFDTWKTAGRSIDKVETIQADELAKITQCGIILNILDVRKETEYNKAHVTGAQNFPLDQINTLQSNIDRSQCYYVHCAGGYRSMVFISILKARGYQYLVDVQGGFNALIASPVKGLEMTSGVDVPMK